jgi:hypothetical protein
MFASGHLLHGWSRAAALECPLRPETDQSLAAMQHVAKGHKWTHALQQTASLFDHLVGDDEQRRRNRETVVAPLVFLRRLSR